MAKEAQRLSESCLYTSTSFFIYLKFLRFLQMTLRIIPLILGSLGGFKLLTDSGNTTWVTVCAVLTFLAGLLPTIYAAMNLDAKVELVGKSAVAFKDLQDRFRQCAMIYSKCAFSEFEREFRAHVEKMEKARGACIAAPEIFFILAKRKIKAGDYRFDIDETSIPNS